MKVTELRQTIPWKMLILLLIWAVAFAPIIPGMVDTWLNHSDNSHSLLVPIISLYFVWQKRADLRRIHFSGSMLGWGVLAVSLSIYLIAYLGGVAFFSRLMMVSSLFGLVWCCLGRQAVRILVFPLTFLFFMVPVPDTLLGMVAFPLQLLATKISMGLIQFCSIPVYREGNMLFFISTQLEVAEACSGIRSVMSLIMLSILISYISEIGWVRKVILIVSSIPIALVANIFRISGTGILAHHFGDKVAKGFLHDLSGMLVFVVGLVVLFAELNILNRIAAMRLKMSGPDKTDSQLK